MILTLGFELLLVKVIETLKKRVYENNHKISFVERESALKILQDVLTQPIMGYDVPTKPRTVFKQPPVPPPVRTTSCTRKLGRTRNHQRLPCEICEKQMIKHHVWNLAR